MGRRQVAVAHRHRERLVPEEVLYRPEVHALHDEVARERVAEGVPRAVRDAGDGADAAKGAVKRRIADGISPWPREHSRTLPR